jgi:hypothetical protein
MPTNYGVGMASAGYIADQTQLLQVIINGLELYNKTVSPMIAALSQDETRETWRVAQAPIPFETAGDGANTLKQVQSYRLLTAPLVSYHTGAAWTIDGLQDALPSDVTSTFDGILAGDVERQETELFKALFTKRTAGAVGTAYQASAWNGETDVPDWKNTTFYGTAHYHYAGINTATLALSHVTAAAQDIKEHGYGQNTIWALFNSAQAPTVAALLNISVASSLITPERVRSQDQGVWQGIRFAGIDFIFDDNVPAGYFGVIDPTVTPLRRRVHPNPDARGLQMFSESFDEHYPLAGRNFRRRYGWGWAHLGAGTFRQIVASTTYTNPSWRLTG